MEAACPAAWHDLESAADLLVPNNGVSSLSGCSSQDEKRTALQLRCAGGVSQRIPIVTHSKPRRDFAF
jgi:hypothetical protein